MSEQRTHEHLLWELHQAELEHDRMLARIDVLLNRNAVLQIQLRDAQRAVTTQPEGKA